MTSKPIIRTTALIAVCLLPLVMILAALSALPARADEDLTPEIPIGAEVITSVSLQALPEKTQYYVGEDLEIDGAMLLVEYNTGRTVFVNVLPGWCSDFDSYTDGIVEISVQYPYGGNPVVFSVTVLRPKVTGIYLVSAPEKRVYYTGEEFDPTGLCVMATRTDGESVDVTNEIVMSGFDIAKPEKGKKINCVYSSDSGKFTTFFTVDVFQLEPVRLEIRKMPTRMEYFDGQPFDLTGIGVAVVYNDGHEEYVESLDEITCSGYDPLRLGDQYVTVSCRGKSSVILVRTVKSAVHEHTPGEYIIDREATCTEAGKRHTNCLVCGELIIDDTGLPALGHSFGDWAVIAPPTGATEGVRERVCPVCGQAERESIPRLTNTAVSGEATAVREVGKYYPAGISFDMSSVISTVSYDKIREFQSLITDRESEIVDIYFITFYLDGERTAVDGVTTYTFPAPDGDYSGYRAAIGGEIVKAVWDKAGGTVSFSTSAASNVEGFQAALIAIPAPETSEEETTQSPAVGGTDTEPAGDETTGQGSDPNVAKVGKVIRIAAAAAVGTIVVVFVITLIKKRSL